MKRYPKSIHPSGIGRGLARTLNTMLRWGRCPVFWGRHLARVPGKAVVFFPVRPTMAACGLAGIVAFKHPRADTPSTGIETLETMLAACQTGRLEACLTDGRPLGESHLGGTAHIRAIKQIADRFKEKTAFCGLFSRTADRQRLQEMEEGLRTLIATERRVLAEQQGHLQTAAVERIAEHLETLEDVAWCLGRELLANMVKIEALMDPAHSHATPQGIEVFYNINTVLNSIDHLEVRGRDSAGLSLMFMLEEAAFKAFEEALQKDADGGSTTS